MDQQQHRDRFATWLWEKLLEVRTGELDLDVLALGPNSSVVMYQGYDINAYTFYTGNKTKRTRPKTAVSGSMLVMKTISNWTHTMES